jgi:hypothetical protein
MPWAETAAFDTGPQSMGASSGRSRGTSVAVGAPRSSAHERWMMTVSRRTIGATVLAAAVLMTPASPRGQGTAEVFTATAAVKGAGGASASAPVTVTVDRKMSQSEADPLVAAFKAGGADALRKKLVGVPPTGTVRIGGGSETPTRLTIERATGEGRLLTIVADKPLVFVGAGVPGAKPKEGYDFAVIDLQVDAKGGGSGTIAPAAKIKLNQDAFVVEDYSGEVVRLTAVKKTK